MQQWWVREREKVIRKQTLAVGLKGDLEYLNRRFSRFGILVNSQCSSSLVPHALFFSGAFFVLLLVFSISNTCYWIMHKITMRDKKYILSKN